MPHAPDMAQTDRHTFTFFRIWARAPLYEIERIARTQHFSETKFMTSAMSSGSMPAHCVDYNHIIEVKFTLPLKLRPQCRLGACSAWLSNKLPKRRQLKIAP